MRQPVPPDVRWRAAALRRGEGENSLSLAGGGARRMLHQHIERIEADDTVLAP